MEIEEISEGPYGLSVRGRITETCMKCGRCRKKLDFESTEKTVRWGDRGYFGGWANG